MNFILETNRLILRELDETYFEEYNKEFNEQITKFQWPDPFVDRNAARNILNGFIAEMKEGKMLELVILNKNHEFIGSLEIFNRSSKTPELGIWLKRDCHGFGYGYEALKAIVEYLNGQNKYHYYVYHVDIRNVGSIKLVEKFNFKKAGYQELETPSKKKLCLQTYHILNGNQKLPL